MKSTIKDMVAAHDPGNLFDVLVRSHEQVRRAWERPVTPSFSGKDIRQVIMCGMGGSAISGDLAVNFLAGELRIPFMVCRSYNIPAWAGSDTLVIVSSYSGDTEETLSAMEQAIARECRIVCITNGGKIGDRAGKEGIDIFPLDPGLQPRYALYSSFFTLLKLLQNLGLVPDQSRHAASIAGMLESRAAMLKEGGAPLGIADIIEDQMLLIHSAEGVTDAVGARFKAQLNENGKVHAFHAVLPEMNHNEIVGWEGGIGVYTTAIFIVDESYSARIRERIDITSRIIEEQEVTIHTMRSDLADRKERLIDMVYFGDWISYYLALVQGKDPGEIDFIHRVKRHLSARS